MEKAEEKPSVSRVVAELNRKMGANTIGSATKMTGLEISTVKSGVLKLDEALRGGFPLGRMVELYGMPSAGKSLLSLLTVKNAQAIGLDCIYIDAERSFDPKWAEVLRVDTKKLIVTQLNVAEDIVDSIAKLLASRPGMIVVDSVAAMSTRGEMEAESDQQFMAVKARLMSRGLAKLNALNKETLIIWINQLRNTMALYGSPTTTPGGNALKYFASIRIQVSKDTDLITESGKKTDKNIIGQVVNWKVTKNKVGVPYKFGSFKLFYDGRVEE